MRCAYIHSLTVSLEGAVDDAALSRAIRALPKLHEALRGHFSADGDRFILEPSIEPEILRHDLSSLSGHNRDEALAKLVEQDARTPYDLGQGPLFRAAILILDEVHRVVLLSAHEAVCDGWSLDVLLLDLARVYQSLVEASPPPTPPAHAFRDYVASRAAAEALARVETSRNFWRKAFQHLPPPLHLEQHGRRPPVRTFGVSNASRFASPVSLSAARAFSRAEGISQFAVLLSAFAAVLSRVAGAADLVVGTPVAGHPEAGMEDCVGNLATIVPVRCRFDAGQTFRSLCRATHEAILDAREHAAMSFGELVADLHVPRDAARVPLIPVIFTHVQKYAPGKLVFGSSAVDYQLSPRAFDRFELDMSALESHDALEVRLHGNSDLFSRERLANVLDEFDHVLGHGSSEPDATISALKALHDDSATSAVVGASPTGREPWPDPPRRRSSVRGRTPNA